VNAPALEVTALTKRFGATVAVRDVSFALGADELLVLVGPSGCGKSTLLRTVGGIHPADAGRVELSGVVVDDGRRSLPPERRRVGLVFQDHALFPHFDVARNIGFGVREGDRNARVSAMLDLVGLADHARRFPHELSGGERQRVALARALAPGPDLVLLDEPFASLDPNLRTRVRDDVVRILRSTGTPAVFVTHDQAEALAIGDRVAVMNEGRLVQVDTPEGVFHRPVSRFVATFMGPADVVAVADARELMPEAASADETDAVLMLRPDDLVIEPGSDDGLGAVSGAVSGIVTGAEFRGSTWCYTLRLDSGGSLRGVSSHVHRLALGSRAVATMRPGHRPVILRDP
jgi:iron(III) transport system ATP-binding protein